MASILVACPLREEPLPSGPPVAFEYAAVCDAANHQQLVILEGYLDLSPGLLSCYPDEDARTGRSCQVELLPHIAAKSESAAEEPSYYTMFIDEGDRSNEARSRGYGFGSPLKVFTADSSEVDPYDRVRVTGRLFVRNEIGAGAELVCSLAVDRIAIAELAELSWAAEREAEREALQARIDSLGARREYQDHDDSTVE